MFRPTIKHLIEIYYRAWKKAPGEFKEKIESVCIQDYMKNAILLHRSSPVISKVRMVGFKSSAVVTCASCCLFHPKKKISSADFVLLPLEKRLRPCGKNAQRPLQAHSLEISECKKADGQSHVLHTRWRFLSAEFSFFFFFRRQVPNFEVRANAAHLLTEAFPLHDPAHSPQAVEAAIQKQLDMAMVKNKNLKKNSCK